MLAFGSKNFNTSLEELKDHLNFKLNTTEDNLSTKLIENYDILFFYKDYFKMNSHIKLLEVTNKIKILAFYSNKVSKEIFTDAISLPMRIEELNNIIENSVIKKNFIKNSSIKIKNYILNKNEKKLSKGDIFILLTEKEIQFLELLLYNKQSISKKQILEKV